MSAVRTEIRQGSYADSVVLMQLQSDLARLEGVRDVAVVMATPANLELLEASRLLTEEAQSAKQDDLVIVVSAESDEQASEALARVDSLLARRSTSEVEDYRPKSLRAAKQMAPQADWISISVPGKWAGDLAHEAVDLGLNVFLYSDHVSLEEERSLKIHSSAEGRLVLGPDCGTAIVGGVGFGFANRVCRGPVGIVAASGTGIQAITSRVHEMGSGISHAIGTGGRDLSTEVGGSTTKQALDLLARDAATEVIVLASKPPEPAVAAKLLRTAHSLDKPVIVQFADYPAPAPSIGNLVFTRSLSEAADTAVDLARERSQGVQSRRTAYCGGTLHGLFAGGTLALEAVQGLRPFLDPLHTNLSPSERAPSGLADALDAHSILDLGADEYTAGRLHPMIDPTLRLQMLERIGNQNQQGVVLLDVVLGSGSHSDPTAELAPLIRSIRERSRMEFVVVIIGTDDDPQDRQKVISTLEAAGARLASSMSEAIEIVVALLSPPVEADSTSIPLSSLQVSQAINVGLESFYNELVEQEVATVQMEWRPPGGGNPEINSILKRMRA